MAFSARVPVIYGGADIGASSFHCKLSSVELAQPIIDTWCRIVGPSVIDTSNRYGGGTSEGIIAQLNLRGSVVDTKAYPVSPGAHSYEKIKEAVNKAAEETLKGLKIRVFYLHAPGRTVDFKETLRAIDELHKEGKFEHFGLSNFRSYDVAEFVTIARENGWIPPTFYQGVYNAIDRVIESELIPCLRHYNIRFVAYSPLAGGLLAGHLLSGPGESVGEEAAKGGNYDPVKPVVAFFMKRYGSTIPAARKLKEAVEEKGLNLNQASVRWLQHHSKLLPTDGIIFGGSKIVNIERTLGYCTEGPLPDEVVEAFETCYNSIKGNLPNYDMNPPWYNPEVHGV